MVTLIRRYDPGDKNNCIPKYRIQDTRFGFKIAPCIFVSPEVEFTCNRQRDGGSRGENYCDSLNPLIINVPLSRISRFNLVSKT